MRANTDTLKTQEQIRDVLLAPETVDLIEKKKKYLHGICYSF